VSVALTGLSALLVALFIAATLHSLARAQEQEEENSAKTIAESPWQGPIRLAAWVAVAVIVGAVIVGYTAFAAFLVRQIVWAAFVGSGLYLFVLLANDGIAAALEPRALVGRGIVSSLGMRRDSLGQIATLLSGGTSAALFIAAALLMLAPWGVASTDMFGSLRAAYLGFSVDGITISLASILTTLLIFLVVLGITRAVQRWLELTFLPQTQLDSGLRNSIKTSFGYAGFIVAAATALGYLGLTFSQVAIIAGALSVGIGFGLQSIVNNFVSGLILLWERAIRVGDWVVVGDEQGYVKRINVRSTEIETFDRATMIVPNSNLISGVVKNWVSGDRIGRIRLPLPVNLAADPEQVREILVACAKAHDLVVKIPAPQAIFASMAETGLKFELLCYVGDVETALRVKSDLHFEIFKRFREAGIGIAPAAGPPPTINITGLTRATENPSAEVRSTDAPRRIGTK
jgi:small-conductance mechanosensitive channel